MSNERTEAPTPQGDYVPAVCHDGVIYTAGMTPRRAGALVWTGVVGDTLSAEQARSAAGLAALNALSAARAAMPRTGALRCLRMTVFIACAPGFTALSAVADGASAVLAAELGVSALPARSAIGVRALPSGAPVEVELTAAVL
ncbi:MAG: RidA family protein [Mycolicibacterium frederiksbergense]|uniref:RidA family protein n=1 Tax=Mycolicibacterium frederiksbergense TaxID=117567 RepID=A0A6H0S4V2_9MYCO|nr:RidA family protein [Mycolicibacterium frederiksbergense]MBX9921040.1 RidA family protein [Mycolicibacterium frederiksbergense]QIV81057.1 RidA family protein [Mycolicibacterium frederiksbergense]